MSKPQKIGIFGGSFNPVHNGHVNLAKNYLKTLSLDLLLIIPTNIPPHKENKNMAPAQDRLNMLSLAFDGIDSVVVSDIELKSEGKNYTILTLEKLTKIYPDAEFYLIVGGDMFLSFETWRDYKKILSICTVCAAPRKVDEVARLTAYVQKIDPKNENTIILDLPVVDVSSTQVRECILNNGDFKNLVSEKVFDYIIQKELYKND